MEQKTNYTLRAEGSYILIAYRYGHREGHSYLVDLCGGIDTAKERAEEEANERGGKYSVVVFAKHRDTGDMEEIYEAKCPEQYTNGTSPFVSKKDADDLLKAAKAILSETMFFEVGEEGEHFEDSETYKHLEELVRNYEKQGVSAK